MIEANQKLREDESGLELRLERHNQRGDYDPRNTKILHIAGNPMEVALKKQNEIMNEIVEENMKLKEVDIE